ncbi:MAG: hypothetical protein IKR18_10775 [Bacteroidaceae bacterium]|nr:hypothetical protein [Bacteroidaceae bacterium]
MPKYLFTSDQRISELPYRIKKWASFIQEGHDISEITDKSDNNNATTLRFYYNLFAGTETCLKSAEDPIWGIRNFVLKFQFPNVRTPESLYDSLSEKILFAPYRSVVTVLYRMAQLNENTVSYLNKYEILYYLFCNPEVYKNPIVDYDSVINDLLLGREKRIDLTNPISSVLEWKQYDRQAREMLNVLSYASSCFKLSKDTISFSLNSEQYKIDKEYIDQIL